MIGEVITKNFGGHAMFKFSQLGKNSKDIKYVLPKKEINKIKSEVAQCESDMKKGLDEEVAMIRKLKQRSDRVEMYELVITTAQQEIRKLKNYKKEVLVMLPLPMAERNRQLADYLISHHESSIVRIKEEMAKK